MIHMRMRSLVRPRRQQEGDCLERPYLCHQRLVATVCPHTKTVKQVIGLRKALRQGGRTAARRARREGWTQGRDVLNSIIRLNWSD